MGSKSDTLKDVKKYFSSLTARSMKYVLTGLGDGKFIFTTLDPSTLQRRVFTGIDMIHLVTFKDTKALESIYSVFPLFKSTAIIADLRVLLSVINKYGLDNCSMVLENGKVVVKATDSKDATQLVASTDVGAPINEYEAGVYKNYCDRYIDLKGLTATRIVAPISVADLPSTKSGVGFMKLKLLDPESFRNDPSVKEWKTFYLPMYDGKDYPSYYEYWKNNADNVVLNAIVTWRGTSVEAVIDYADEILHVSSFSPKRLWYPRRCNPED